MWTYNSIYDNTDELYHYGVKGMKWGVRRANRKIEKLQARRKQNLRDYEEMKKESRQIYRKDKEKLRKSLAEDKAMYNISEVENKYKIALQKAKKDRAYKESPAYQKAKAEYSKQKTQQKLLGKWGHQRVETLKNMGATEVGATTRTMVEQTLMAGAAAATFIAIKKIANF